MLFYEGGSVDWFYDGLKTEEEMRADERYSKLFRVPCVLYDNAYGKVYSFDTLEHVCARMAIPYSDASVEHTMQCVLSFLDGTYNAPGVDQVYDIAYAARNTANEASSHTTQLAAIATMQVATMDLSDATCDEVVAFRDYWPEWQPDTSYKHNQPLTYQGRYFRASKDLTSQAIYPPGTAESEYYEVELAEDGIIIWYEVGGEYNMVHKGERRHYPDESGPVYEALEDTSYSPDAYPQHWKLV